MFDFFCFSSVKWHKGAPAVPSQFSPPPPPSTPEYKKSFENDAQSSDNINFLKVQWSSRQLPTVRLHAGPGFVGEAQREVQQSEFGEGRQRQQSAHISMHVVG